MKVGINMKEFLQLTTESDDMIFISIYSIEAIEQNKKNGGTTVWMNGKSCFIVKESIEQIAERLSIRTVASEDEDEQPQNETMPRYRKYNEKAAKEDI